LSERKRLEVRQPILTNQDLEKIRAIGEIADNAFHAETLDITVAVERVAKESRWPWRVCATAPSEPCSTGHNIIILSTAGQRRARRHSGAARHGGRAQSPDPQRAATSVGLVVETGEPREVHQFCLLAATGAEAINPYLAFETLLDMHAQGAFPEVVDADEVIYRFIKSVGKGILKVMSKMGISTYQSYCGAQIFDAVGLSSEFIERSFFGTATQIEGIGLA
jgi:glutamate synthase (NADPH/NADH) large chain